MESISLQSRIQTIRRRLLLIRAASAVCWGLSLTLALVLIGIWLDLLWELPAVGRAGTLSASMLAGFALTIVLIIAGFITYKGIVVARRLDQAAQHGGAIVAGWELSAESREGGQGTSQHSPSPEMTERLARMAIAHAAQLAEAVPAASAAPSQPFRRSLFGLAVPMWLMVALLFIFPELAQTEWTRFRYPTDDVPPFSLIKFEVAPGDAEVVYGGDLEISATTDGGLVEQVELVLPKKDGSEEVLPMFRHQDGRWQTVLSRITEPGDYYLRTRGARTRRFSIRVITVPRIEEVRVRITPPAYTRQAYYEGPLPRDGIVGLVGTKVELWATSNRPLFGGKLTVHGGQAADPNDRRETNEDSPADATSDSNTVELDMVPVDAENQQVVGQFYITADGNFELCVTDTAGQDSQDTFAGTITTLADERPFIRLTQPPATSFATPTIVLPVEISAEDDYGISRVQLYRSLNDSRPLAADLPLGKRVSNSVDELVTLPLAEYDLVPGDVIKLFARVEDNDPAGAKGAESTVVVVQIISQEQFEMMLQVREGIEVLLSKYDAARRHLESLAEQIDKLQKDLEASSDDEKETKKNREKMKKLLDELQKAAKALDKLSRHKLPVDLDENLSPQIEKMAEMTQEMAEELAKFLKESGENREQIERQLKKMAEQLNQKKQDFNEQVTEPLEHFKKVFPLMVDQQRFVMIVLRQNDLAERLATLKGHDNEDDPAIKARMRDLEAEQNQIRKDLDSLLTDIENHVERLPDDQEFDELRRTAIDFVDDLRASNVLEIMAEAETALAEFSGTRGHEKALEAAQILNMFVQKCDGMSQCAGNCMKFQPRLSNCMGDSIPQLMQMMGMGSGSGGGIGMGSGGYSAQPGGYGLYGGLPGMTPAYGNVGQGRGNQNPSNQKGSQFSAGSRRLHKDIIFDELEDSDASGIGQEAVPVGSRRRVGQYIQRVNEEAAEPSRD